MHNETSFNIYTELSESFWLSDLIIWPETAISSKYHQANNFISKSYGTPKEVRTRALNECPK